MKAYVVARSSGVELLCPFQGEFIDQLKRSVPSDYRSWSAESKSWFVERRCADQAERLARLYFDKVERLFDESSRPVRFVEHPLRDCLAAVRRAHPDHATLGILPGTSEAVTRSAYHCLALELHPDRGGSHEAMVCLNLAFERLSRSAAR
jgi:hypothetical protein